MAAPEANPPRYVRRRQRTPRRRAGQYAMLPPRRNSSVSSSALKTVGELAPTHIRLADHWQTKAYELVQAVGEAGYVVNVGANAIGSADLVPMIVDPDGDRNETDDERVVRVMRAFTGPRGGQRELKRRAGLHLTIAGESYLLGTPIPPEEGEGIFWEFLSTEEVKLDRAGQATRLIEGQQMPIAPDAFIARLWRSDAAFSDRADSSVRRVLPILAELAILTQLVEGQLKSRIPAGLLFIPEEMSFPGDDTSVGGEQPVDGQGEPIEELSEELLKHLSAPLTDPTSAASLVPLVVRGPGESGQYMRLISLSAPDNSADGDWALKLREEALKRLARGLDVPPEEMEGKSGLSGLGGGNVASSIDVDFIVKHVTPAGELLAEFVTTAYLRPMLVAFEGMSPEEAGRFAVDFDASGLIGRADEAASSRALWDMEEISDDALLRTNGFEPGDKPEGHELTVRRAWKLVREQPASYGKLLNLIPGFESIDTDDMAPAGPPVAAPVPPGTPSPAVAAPQAPTAPPPEPPPAIPQAPAASMLERLAVAADAALDTARTRAAARVFTKAEKAKLDVRSRISNGDKTVVLQLLRPGELDQMGETPTTLLLGAWDRLELRVRQWVSAALLQDGAEPRDAAQQAAVVGRELVMRLNEFAIVGLFDAPEQFGNGLAVPNELVLAALEVGSLLVP